MRSGEKVEVLEDTHRLVTKNWTTAPWLKVRAASGGTGYIFGGTLEIAPEQSFDFQDPANFTIQPPEGKRPACWDERDAIPEKAVQ